MQQWSLGSLRDFFSTQGTNIFITTAWEVMVSMFLYIDTDKKDDTSSWQLFGEKPFHVSTWRRGSFQSLLWNNLSDLHRAPGSAERNLIAASKFSSHNQEHDSPSSSGPQVDMSLDKSSNPQVALPVSCLLFLCYIRLNQWF